MDPKTTKTPLRIRIFAGLASLALILLIALAIKALFFMKPEVITTTSRIILPNDSLITLREQLAGERARVSELQATAAARLETIRNLTSPLTDISDTLLALQRTIYAGNSAQWLAIERDRADRADRYLALKESADRVERLQQGMPNHFQDLQSSIAAALQQPADTIRIEEPRRRNFFNRILSRK